MISNRWLSTRRHALFGTWAIAITCAGLALPAGLAAQRRTPATRTPATRLAERQPIGVLSTGDTVQLETRSVKRDGPLTAAIVRVQFLKPAKVGGSEWRSSRTIVRLDCAKQVAAVTENWYYSDARGTVVANHKVVAVPGYGAPLPGSVTAVAMKYLCRA